MTDAAIFNFGDLRESSATGGATSTFSLAGAASLQGAWTEGIKFHLSDAASLTVSSLHDNPGTTINFTSHTITGSARITNQSLADVQALADKGRFLIAGVSVGQSELNIVANSGDVFVTPIPEPSHLALSILVGGAGICFSRRRRNRNVRSESV